MKNSTYSPYSSAYFANLVLISTAMLAIGCGKTESTPSVSLAFGSATAQNSLLEMLLPTAQATPSTLSGLKMCFKRIRAKTEDDLRREHQEDRPGFHDNHEDDSDNIDFQPGEVIVGLTGAELGEVKVNAGVIKRIELDFEKDGKGCSSGKSISFSNSLGAFSTEDHVTVKFEGRFEASQTGQKITLGLQAIRTALELIAANGDIRDKLEDVSIKGSF